MKTSRYFSALLLTLLLLIFSRTMIAQSWDNFNPLHVSELELSSEQNTQLSEIGNRPYQLNFKRLNDLANKYQNEINTLEGELLYAIKETAKKGTVIASAEYPIPPVALWINEIELDKEMKKLFLLLDPASDFSIDLPNFEAGEGQHVASTFLNPANKNQTLEFHTQQDGKVTIEIIDKSEKVVKIIPSKNRMKGNQKLEVNLQNLNS